MWMKPDPRINHAAVAFIAGMIILVLGIVGLAMGGYLSFKNRGQHEAASLVKTSSGHGFDDGEL
jgi:hypothetical protein